MELLQLEHFAGCVNETFQAALNDGSVDFVLVEASPLPDRGGEPLRDAPSRCSSWSRAPVLFPQQTYRMSHPRLGELGIFIVPVAQNREGFVYQAVFN